MNKMAVANEPLNARAAGLAMLTAVLGGGNSVSIKLALDGMPPIALAGVRFAIGGGVVLVWAIVNGVSLRMSRHDRHGLGLLAALFLAQILLLNVGTHHTSASRSTLMICTYPFFTSLFAHLFIPGDRLTTLKIAGMVLSLVGVALMFTDDLKVLETSHLIGDVMVLGSAMLLGARQVYTKRLTQHIHPCQLIVWQAAISLPFFAVLNATLESHANYQINAAIVAAIAFQGVVVAGICFILFVSLLRRYRASQLGVFGFITPVVGVLASDLLLHEKLSPLLAGSMVLVGAGIAIVNWQVQDDTA